MGQCVCVCVRMHPGEVGSAGGGQETPSCQGSGGLGECTL